MKTMVVRGHEFTSYDGGDYWESATSDVRLDTDVDEESSEWRAWMSINDAHYEAVAGTAAEAFTALQSKVEEFCREVLKNFEEVKP